MNTYSGSCHCGKVTFEIETDLKTISECNCSICTKKGALHHRVSEEHFRLLTGSDALTLYQFNTKTAKHYFCKYCGIHPFSRPRLAPDQYSVNIRCLDDYYSLLPDLEKRSFDGINWEESAENFKKRLKNEST